MVFCKFCKNKFQVSQSVSYYYFFSCLCLLISFSCLFANIALIAILVTLRCFKSMNLFFANKINLNHFCLSELNLSTNLTNSKNFCFSTKITVLPGMRLTSIFFSKMEMKKPICWADLKTAFTSGIVFEQPMKKLLNLLFNFYLH